MERKTFFVFLLAVALAFPLATAYNCTKLDGEEKNVCNYVEGTNWNQSVKDEVIEDAINSGSASLNGNFNPKLGKIPKETIKLNKLNKTELKISDDNKTFLIDFSSISLFIYAVYSFLKRYYLLLNFL